MSAVTKVDLYTREMSIDPYPVLAQIRQQARAVWHDTYQLWLVVGYEDVMAICRDDVNFTAEDGIVAHNFGPHSMLARDGTDHRKIRGVWNRQFLGQMLANRGPLVDRISDKLLAPLIARLNTGETVDFAPAARALPVEVVAELFGIPDEFRPSFARWSDEITEMTGFALPPDHPVEIRRVAAQREVADLFRAEVAKRRTKMQDDLIGDMVASGIEKDFGAEALVDNCRLLLVAGNETTTKFIGNSIVTLHRFPKAQAEIRADKSLLPQALEEVLRYDGVVHTGFRRAKSQDAHVGDVKIPVGDQIWLQFGGANRDPARFQNPDTFDIRRKSTPHIAFGSGPHTCLGLNLARMEGASFIGRFFDQVPAYEVAEVDYELSFPLRGPHKLMIRKK